MNVLDLFSGIGGFSLGLERAGMRTVAFCEIDSFARRVLAKHWPGIPCYDDVRNLTADRLKADGITADVICGGFPCQDISEAGLGAGIRGKRSGLWIEYARIIGELRPRFVIVENVAALLYRGLDVVLGDLAALGFDAEWNCIPASAVGAPHVRDRLWIVAYPNGQSEYVRAVDAEMASLPASMADTPRELLDWPRTPGPGWRGQLADGSWWSAEPDVGRVANGIRNRTHRLRGLGNAVVPQIPEIIGRAIMTLTSHQRSQGRRICLRLSRAFGAGLSG
jgi:DNA (cytosine-5)-methyltransferase 1